MRIIYLYDTPGWALHNVGKLLQPGAERLGWRFDLVAFDDYVRNPTRTDVVYLSFGGMLPQAAALRPYCREIVCSLHDPCEVSHFTDRFTWPRLPMRPLALDAVDRVSVISREMQDVVATRYGVRAYLTPTFPSRADDIRARRRARGPAGDADDRVRFFSTAIHSPHFSTLDILRRTRFFGDYLRDERGRVSPRQMSAMLVRTRRKNLPLLTAFGERIATHPRAEIGFSVGFSAATRLTDAEYLDRLAGSDVYVCTSFMEGGPLPVMEAVLAGNAVLTTRVGQVERWVVHGENGFICSTLDEFVAAAAAYLDDDALLRAHQARSRQIGDAATFDFTPWEAFLRGTSAPAASLPAATRPDARSA